MMRKSLNQVISAGCICDKLCVTERDNRLRDDDHGKYRNSAPKDYNVNHGFTIKILVIFHNFRSHDSHLIMQ